MNITPVGWLAQQKTNKQGKVKVYCIYKMFTRFINNQGNKYL